MTALVAVLRSSFRIQRVDLATPIVMALLPLLLIPFLMPGAQAQLHASGYSSATGAEQVVPGFAALFGFLAVQQIVTGFGREHQWGTWIRLRVAPITVPALIFGRSIACLIVQLGQLVCVITAGVVLFGYRPNGSLLGLVLVLVALSVMLVAFGVMLVAVFPSAEHALVAASLGGMLMAGIGGALAPVSSFPEWAQFLAHGSPAFWALDAMRALSLDHAGLREIAPGLCVMLGFTVLFSVTALLCFRASLRRGGAS